LYNGYKLEYIIAFIITPRTEYKNFLEMVSKVQSENSVNDKNLEIQVYEQILTLLPRQGLTDASNFTDQKIAQTLGVSRTPVRMALARLESEGLVRKAPGRGWIAAPLTLKDIEEIFDLKEILETIVARTAAEKITPESAEALMNILDEMKQIAAEENLEKWFGADDRFHDLLLNLVGNERLKRFLKRLNSQYFRFRVGFTMMDGRMAAAYEEHRQVAEAIVSGNPELAAENTLNHLRHIRTNLVSIIKKILIPFMGQEL